MTRHLRHLLPVRRTAVLLLGGLGLLLIACNTSRAVWHMPAHARREAPPEGLEASALAVGQTAPELEVLGSITSPTVIVFYRGFW